MTRARCWTTPQWQRALADATPRHVTGTMNGYHAMTYGWLVGELVRRITGASLGEFVQTHIAAPLGLDGCYIGTPEDPIHRVAAFPRLAPEKATLRTVAKALDPIVSLFGVSPERRLGVRPSRRARGDCDRCLSARRGPVGQRCVHGARPRPALRRTRVRRWCRRSPAVVAGYACGREQATEQSQRPRDTPQSGMAPGLPPAVPKEEDGIQFVRFLWILWIGAFADPGRNLAVGMVCQQAKQLPLTKLVGPILHAVDTVRSGTD